MAGESDEVCTGRMLSARCS